MKNIMKQDIQNWLEVRRIRPEEAEEAARVEAICFPPSEACTLDIMKERVAAAADSFLAAIDRRSGQMIGFINGLCSSEETLRDELFTDTSLHDPNGKNVMICGVDVLPEYRLQGIARAMMKEFLNWQRVQGKEKAILTCVPEKVSMYQKFGFTDLGDSDSAWGGEKWHEMYCLLERPLKIYLASPFFNEKELKDVMEAEQILEKRGYSVFSPRKFECREEEFGTPAWAKRIFEGDVAAIDECDVMVMLYHGNYSDSGTAWECGYAYGIGKPVVTVQIGELSNLMVHVSAQANIRMEELAEYDFSLMPEVVYTGDMT